MVARVPSESDANPAALSRLVLQAEEEEEDRKVRSAISTSTRSLAPLPLPRSFYRAVGFPPLGKIVWSIEGTILAAADAYLNRERCSCVKKRQISLAHCGKPCTRVFTIHDAAAARYGGGGSIAFVRSFRVGAKGEGKPWGKESSSLNLIICKAFGTRCG